MFQNGALYGFMFSLNEPRRIVFSHALGQLSRSTTYVLGSTGASIYQFTTSLQVMSDIVTTRLYNVTTNEGQMPVID